MHCKADQYSTIRPGNYKQKFNLDLVRFHETTTAAIITFFSERFEAANILPLFYKFFVICNSKHNLILPTD